MRNAYQANPTEERKHLFQNVKKESRLVFTSNKIYIQIYGQRTEHIMERKSGISETVNFWISK